MFKITPGPQSAAEDITHAFFFFPTAMPEELQGQYRGTNPFNWCSYCENAPS